MALPVGERGQERHLSVQVAMSSVIDARTCLRIRPCVSPRQEAQNLPEDGRQPLNVLAGTFSLVEAHAAKLLSGITNWDWLCLHDYTYTNWLADIRGVDNAGAIDNFA
ncbi:hypothetical protein CERZMDRAFT_103349 [Cercospora zeae-maydis SCOH1-5]|uniref:Uncharacterized protein n=1 Tax=Cercospora zeae-maydis SCOH1-5 TaxID=717836 RepID=A0A6A6EZ45_9PEZI|nr:hypothetical protein CERZMDRAFT_103349 [Cercospora zeae-maydis SCOH1-5]